MADEQTMKTIIVKLASLGVRMVVADQMSLVKKYVGWQRLPNSDHFVYDLSGNLGSN